MINPTSVDLLKGVEEALRETVLPELARGTSARKQLQAALEILRHVAHALPWEAETLAADNADMAVVLETSGAALPTAGADPAGWNLALQQALGDLQDRLPGLPAGQRAETSARLVALYKRSTDRAMALIPPPMPRPPKVKS
jgi:hypothetical protein